MKFHLSEFVPPAGQNNKPVIGTNIFSSFGNYFQIKQEYDIKVNVKIILQSIVISMTLNSQIT